jgi:hypothetical protein
MAGAIIEAVGLPKFLKYLKVAGEVELPKRLAMANREIAAELAAEIAARAPRGTTAERDRHPGRLASTVVGRATARQVTVSIGKGIRYTKPIVFGWKAHGIKPNPFPLKVLDEQRVAILARYQAGVRDALRSKA